MLCCITFITSGLLSIIAIRLKKMWSTSSSSPILLASAGSEVRIMLVRIFRRWRIVEGSSNFPLRSCARKTRSVYTIIHLTLCGFSFANYFTCLLAGGNYNDSTVFTAKPLMIIKLNQQDSHVIEIQRVMSVCLLLACTEFLLQFLMDVGIHRHRRVICHFSQPLPFFITVDILLLGEVQRDILSEWGIVLFHKFIVDPSNRLSNTQSDIHPLAILIEIHNTHSCNYPNRQK